MSSSTLKLLNSNVGEAVVPSSLSSILKRARISDSATSIGNLPDDLVMETIARSSISCKSATRCKCVCKRWLNLIVSPLFVHRLLCLQRPHENERLGFIQQFDHFKRWDDDFVCDHTARIFTHWSPFSLSLSFLPCCDENVWILASFNDLLVCCPSIHDHSAYYICNPVTKQYLLLPPPRLSMERVKGTLEKIHVAFICDPCYNICDDNVVINPKYTFKLVCFNSPLMRCNSVDIISSETGKWSTLAMQGWDQICYINRVLVYNGAVLWQKQGLKLCELDTRY